MNRAQVGIVGYRGYSGAELVRILERHPGAEPVLLEHRDAVPAGPKIRNQRGISSLPCEPGPVREAGGDKAPGRGVFAGSGATAARTGGGGGVEPG